MKKHIAGILVLILIILLILLGVGIHQQKKEEETPVVGDITLYYVAADNLSLQGVPYQFKNTEGISSMAEEVLKALQKDPKGEECKRTIPQNINWTDITQDGTNLIIDFTSSYSKLNNTQEIFLRAGTVKTLVQLEGVKTVEFKVGGMPLMSTGNQTVGMMNADHFIDEQEENWGVNQRETTTLYYASEDGTHLLQENVVIEVVNNVPMEQSIIETLMNPKDKDCLSPIPEGTHVNKTVTKDEICYVDFSKDFLNPMENVSPEVTVYAIVNSLVERDNVSKVQFTIDGEKVSSFLEVTGFDTTFERNLDLVESAQENQEKVTENMIIIETEESK